MTVDSDFLRPDVRWADGRIDEDYLERLEQSCTPPNGELVREIWRYEDCGPGHGASTVAIWKCNVRGDDVLALIQEVRAHRTECA